MAASFKYNALNGSGEKVSGEIDASSKSEAMRKLLVDGFQPITVAPLSGVSKSRATKGDDAPIHLKSTDVVAFTEELAELLEAGLPLEPALSSMSQRDESGKLKEISSRLRKWITEGNPMHSALPRTSKSFDPLYCNLVKAGEASGSLRTILHQHAIYLKAQMELKSKLISAMIYPAFLMIACIGVICVFIFYLLPQITTLLDGMTGGKPFGVVVAIHLGDLLRNHWMTMLLVLIILMFLVKIWHTAEKNKQAWDKYKLKIPLYGQVLTFGFYVQWLKTLGNLVGNGVPLVEALELTQETVTNRHAKHHLEDLILKVKDGYKLTHSMRSSKIFTPNMIDLIGVGESTGKLSKALNRASDYYDKRLNVLLSNLVGIISPVILISMALLVGALCWTMIQAIYESIGNLRSK